MTYETLELSVDDSRPVEFVEILFDTLAFRYTTADTPLGHGGNTYTPVAGAVSNIESADDPTKASCSITLPRVDAVGDLFRVQPPSGIVTVTIWRDHYLDGDAQVVFKGRVVNAEWSGPLIKLKCESAITSLLRGALRRRFSNQCPHALYDQELGTCRVNKAAFTNTCTAVSWTGKVIVTSGLPVKPNGWYSGGMVQWVNVDGVTEKRMIANSNSDGTLTLTMLPFSLVAGSTISVLAGCDHLLETCHTKFNNSDNFGGTPFVPVRNPFGGSNLY